MKVSYHDDLAKGSGFGYLSVSDVTFAAGTYLVSIQRGDDRTFVSPEGEWSEPQSNFPVEATLASDGSLRFPLPQRVQHALETAVTYRVTLSGESGAGKAQLVIDTISYGLEDALNHAKVLTETPPAQGQPENIPEPEPTPPVTPPAEPQPEKSKSLLPWALGWAALLLLVLGGVAYWFYHKDQPKDESKEEVVAEAKKADEPKAKPEKALEPKAKEASQPKPEVPVKTPSRSIAEEVQLFFAGTRTPANAVELANRLKPSSAVDQDALFRLYYFAVERGSMELLLPYAACFDPSKPAWGSIEKNAPIAWSLYEKGRGNPALAEQAKEAQNALYAWLQREKEAGNSKAKAWFDAIRKP